MFIYGHKRFPEIFAGFSAVCLLTPILLCFLSACSLLNLDSAPVARVCPSVHVWSKDEQKRVDAYYTQLSGPDADLLKGVIKEWISLHRQAESCQE